LFTEFNVCRVASVMCSYSAPYVFLLFSLHDALPIYPILSAIAILVIGWIIALLVSAGVKKLLQKLGTNTHLNTATGHHSNVESIDRKSTRLNSSHVKISYAVFCLKKKNYNKLLKSYC